MALKFLPEGFADNPDRLMRFLRDPRRWLPLGERRYRDWDRKARDHEILAAVQVSPGGALVRNDPNE